MGNVTVVMPCPGMDTAIAAPAIKLIPSFTVNRYNDLDSDRPPLEFGVRWDTSAGSPTLTRLGDAVGLTVNTATSPHVSGFDAYMPWMGMRRCVLSDYSGDVMAYPGELDDTGEYSLYDDLSAKVMVEIPKFWVKFEETDDYYDYWISPYPLKGYRLHPAFDHYGTVVDHVYVGAYEAYVYDSLMYSQANRTPTGSTSRTNFRAAAQAWGVAEGIYGWTMMDYTVFSAIQLLYLIEYASLNSQAPSGSATIGGLGEGLQHASAISLTGWTSPDGPTGCVDLGSSSGVVNVTDNDYAMSYRGIENLWGNTMTQLDGVNIDTNGRLWIADYRNMAGYTNVVTLYTEYYMSGCILPVASGYIKKPYFNASYSEACELAPLTTTGASGTTYMCDYYTTTDYTTIKTMCVGGYWSLAGNADYGGIFYTNTSYGIADTNAVVGTRIQFVPADYMGWKRY